MLRVNVFQIGMRRKYIEAEAFQKIGVLNNIYTDLWEGKLLKLSRSRKNTSIDGMHVKEYWIIGVLYPLLRKLLKTKRSLDILHYCVAWSMAKLAGKEVLECDYLYAYSGEAIFFKRSLEKVKCKLILDQKGMPRVFYRRVFEKEVLSDKRVGSGQDRYFWDKVEEIERAEWSMATIVTCGSTAVAEELVKAGCLQDKIRVIKNYYVAKDVVERRICDEKKLKVLFVGNIHPLKGVQYIIKAARRLEKDIDFTLVGSIDHRFKYLLDSLPSNIKVVGHITHDDLCQYYTSHDLFLFPSLSEGSAMVTYEAMAYGLPVICTHVAGSIVADCNDGEIIYDLSVDLLVEKIAKLNADRGIIDSYSKNALKSIKKYSKEKYFTSIQEIIM